MTPKRTSFEVSKQASDNNIIAKFALEQLLEAKEWNLAGTKDVAEGVCRLGTEMAPEELATWAVALPEQTEIRNLFHREIEPGPAKRGLELATGLGKPDGLP